jgi:hypothetical protein
LIVAPAAQNRGARVLVLVFVGPLPDIFNRVQIDKKAAYLKFMMMNAPG